MAPLVAAGLIAAIPAVIKGVSGIVQGISGRKREKQALANLENLQTPTYTSSKSISDYYNNALQRYGVNPYQSQQYQQGINASNRNMAAGLSQLNNIRGGVGGVSRLTALSNNAALKAGMNAEDEQSRRFSQLGGASQLKAADDITKFQYNEYAPYEKKYNLYAAKAGAGGQQYNAGIQNAFGGLSDLSSIASDYYRNKAMTTAKYDASNE